MKKGKRPAQPAGAGVCDIGDAALRSGKAPPRPASPAHHLSFRLTGALLLSLALSGCTHKIVWTPPNTALAPVDLEPVPEPAEQPTFATLPLPEWDGPEAVELPKRPVRRRPASPVGARDTGPQPPTQAVAESEIAELAIGSLSSGGDATPQTQQEARDLIAAIQKRVVALPRSAATQQRVPLRQVTSFLKQAEQALSSGDAAGAVTLATKARLLMDDIEKK